MGITFMQIIKSSLYFGLGMILAYVIPYKMGNTVLDIFYGMGSTGGLMTILTLMQYFTIFIIAFVAPVILFYNSKTVDKVIQKIGG